MSLNIIAIQNSIYDIVTPILGTVIWANPNANRPVNTYYDMKITPISKIGGSDYQGYPDVTGIASFLGNREFTLQFRSFGTGGIDGLANLYDQMEKPSVLSLLNAQGLAFIRFLTGVLDITEIVNSTPEERGVLDMQIRTSSEFSDNVGVIDELYCVTTIKEFNDTVSTDIITITA